LHARQDRPGLRLPRRVADHPREIADEEDDAVPHLLEVLHLADDDGMAEVQVGRGGVEADLDRERLRGAAGALQLREKLLRADDLARSLAQIIELLLRRPERRLRPGSAAGASG